MIKFNDYIGTLNNPVIAQSPARNRPLPLQRSAFANDEAASGLTYGDYFETLRQLLLCDDARLLCAGLSRLCGRTVTPAEIGSVDLLAMKHGQFYHPAQVCVNLDGRRYAMVLNVALTPLGLACIEREYRLLDQLGQSHAANDVPKVLAIAKANTHAGIVAAAFLGQWLEGFYEFHWSKPRTQSALAVTVWDTDNGDQMLAPEKSEQIYRRAAQIMTACYNPATFEQVSHWHHAAGDFVVNPGADPPAVKLITVRAYEPLIELTPESGAAGHSPQTLLQMLLLFLTNLSLRMRLDRLDGVGNTIWAPDYIVAATVNGFKDAMQKYKPLPQLPAPADAFADFASRRKIGEVAQWADLCVETFSVQEADVPVIQSHLAAHVKTLHRALRRTR